MTTGTRKFVVIIPVLNQHDVTEKFLESWFSLSKSRLRVLFIDNGSDEWLSHQDFIHRWNKDHRISVVRNDSNTGVYPTFQQGYEMLNGEAEHYFYSHNDVEMLEYGWDEKLIHILDEIQGRTLPGVCGMYGAKGIGTPDIYEAEYHFSQLMRWNCVTVKSMVHANERELTSNYDRIVVLDGFSMIVSDNFMQAMDGKFDYKRYPVHHSYDQDICLDAHFRGFKNFVLNIDCKHHGGMTSTREKWAEGFGTTDLKTHREAHVVMYEKYRGRLPVSVK